MGGRNFKIFKGFKIKFIIFALCCSCIEVRASDPFATGLGGGAPIRDGFFYSFEDTSGTTLENRLRDMMKLSQVGDDTWSAQETLGNFNFVQPVQFAGTGASLPTNFWDIEAGGVYKHQYDTSRDLAVYASVGSASDQPFYTFNEDVFQVTGTYRLSLDQERGWIFLLNLSNNRPFLNYLPLPGASYFYRTLDQHFSFVVGFPINMVTYEFAKGLTGKASFIGISQFSAELSQKVFESVSIYTGFDWGQRVWFRAGRPDLSNRLFYDQKKASVGSQVPLSRSISIDLSGAYHFGRQVFEAHNYYGSSSGLSSLDPGWTVQVMLGFKGAGS